MQLHSIKNNNPNFKSGLTYKIIKDIKNINVEKAESDFTALGVDANFIGSKSICANSILASNILSEIAEKYKLPFDYKPPAIRAFHSSDLIEKSDRKAVGFCIPDTKSVLKNEPPYIGGSIFMNKSKNGIFWNNLCSDYEYLTGWHSSPHFLATTLHEWFHCIHMNLIYKQKGYEGECPVLKQKYYKEGAGGLDTILTQSLLGVSSNVVKFIGNYAFFSRSMLEVFAELMTKITTEALNKDLKVIKNPLDNIPKDFPKEYKHEIEKILKI